MRCLNFHRRCSSFITSHVYYCSLLIVLESAPSWHVKPHNVTLYKGQIYYTLPCKTYGYPEPSYTWLKDNYPIRPWDVDLAPRGKELIFLVARTWDSGKYTCTASNIKGSISESVYVSVVPGMSLSNDTGKTRSSLFCYGTIRFPQIEMFSCSHRECMNLQKCSL